MWSLPKYTDRLDRKIPIKKAPKTKKPKKSPTAKPPRPVLHEEDLPGEGTVVIINPDTFHLWAPHYHVRERLFLETARHRMEVRWSRRKYPLILPNPMGPPMQHWRPPAARPA